MTSQKMQSSHLNTECTQPANTNVPGPIRILTICAMESHGNLIRDRLIGSGRSEFIASRASSYSEGLELIQKGAPDLALIFQNIAHRSGLELIREVRKKGLQIPLILVSDRTDQAIILEARRAGATTCLPRDYLNTPLLEHTIHGALELQRSEQNLHEKELKLRSILDTAAEGIMVIHRDGQLDSLNPAARLIFGCSGKDVKNRDITAAVPEFFKQAPFPFRPVNDLIDDDSPGVWQFETFGIRADGSKFPLYLSVSEMLFDGQKWYIAIVHDLTSEKERIHQLMDVNKFTSIGTLAAGVAHEFKNYLAGIVGNASFALEYLESEDGLILARDALRQVVEISENANRTTLSLLTYSRSNPEDRAWENPNELITGMVKLIEKEACACDIEIRTSLAETPCMYISGGQLQQLILNLLLNAKQAIKMDGVISVSTAIDQDQLVVCVADTGSGIPPESLDRIFDPFFSTKGVWGPDNEQGTGLGLSVCRNIAIEHGGQISVESSVGQGSIFTVRLPLIQDQGALGNGNYRFSNQPIVLFSAELKVIEFFRTKGKVWDASIEVAGHLEDLENSGLQNPLVIFDMQFPGLCGLFRVAEYCRARDLRYLIVNASKAPGCQLKDIFPDALAQFSNLPE